MVGFYDASLERSLRIYGKSRLFLIWCEYAKQNAKGVGFYRDHGETRLITKSAAMLNRREMIEEPKGLRGTSPSDTLQKLNTKICKLTAQMERLERELEKCDDEQEAAQLISLAESRGRELGRLIERLPKQ